MKRLVALGLFTLVSVGCSGAAAPSPTAEPARSVPTAIVLPTAPPTAVTELLSSERVAEGYLRALYARDAAGMARFFSSKPDAQRDEYELTLEGLTVRILTPEQAGDKNPVTKMEYVEATAKVSAKGKSGVYTYRIATRIEGRARVIAMIQGPMRDW